MKKLLAPNAIAARYRVGIRQRMRAWHEHIAQETLSRWAANPHVHPHENVAREPPTIGRLPRTDAPKSWIRDRMRALSIDRERYFGPAELKPDLAIISTRVVQHVDRYIATIPTISLKTQIGPQVSGWMAENIDRITKLSLDDLQTTQEILEYAQENGLRVEDIADDFEERLGVSASRAELIARDQTLKLCGQINRARQTQSGITRYQWSTSADERVRDGGKDGEQGNHADLDGQIFQWGSPPDTGGDEGENEPGQAIQCRCVGLAILGDIDDLDDLDGDEED